jgi:hypothetical protein
MKTGRTWSERRRVALGGAIALRLNDNSSDLVYPRLKVADASSFGAVERYYLLRGKSPRQGCRGHPTLTQQGPSNVGALIDPM